MTAVASPPSLQSLPRLGWNSPSSSHAGGLNSMSAEDVSRIVLPRKGPQRSNSSSSVHSVSSAASDSSAVTTLNAADGKPTQEAQATNGGEPEGWAQNKPEKYGRSLWSSSSEEAGGGAPAPVANGRPLSSAPSSGPVAAPAMSALHAPSNVVPSQKQLPVSQMVNGPRVAPAQMAPDPPALLVLLPMNGTFERKQITVPPFPEILRIGRQTNAKTVPTPSNGYFDSKVLSRQHAEIWADRNGKVWIRDVKSSNGTFVNGVRLSPESRDSEPHELRENDMLELGIDIVSEDQKSIVHHKVSAKIEHAGIPSASTNVLDLNFGDIDPSSGNGLIGSMFPQNGHVRGRTGSQSSNSSVRTMGPQGVMAGNANGLGVQRHASAWLSPVSVEQVVKRLTLELKQAKQQSQDLNRTGDYFTALFANDPSEDPPPEVAELLAPHPKANGAPLPPKFDGISALSKPPAPPPQQPLPEKPDAVRLARSESDRGSSSFNLPDAARSMSLPKNIASPFKPDSTSSQLLSLAEALRSAKKELDAQGNRVRNLEEMLKQERRARETAEERARHMQERSRFMQAAMERTPQVRQDTFKATAPESSEAGTNGSPTKLTPEPVSSSRGLVDASPASTSNGDKTGDAASAMDASAQRVAHLVSEMDALRGEMETHKRRAETAEKENLTLLEKVQRIRQEERAKAAAEAAPAAAAAAAATTAPGETSTGAAADAGLEKRRSTEMATQTDARADGAADGGSTLDAAESGGPRGGAAGDAKQARELQSALAQALARHGDGRLAQGAPYASMLGVVLIGVGLMAYLNGWNKVER